MPPKTKHKGKPQTPEKPTVRETLSPQKVHDLLSVHGPYDSPPEPSGWPDRITLWDPGLSILDLRKKYPHLFYPTDWFTDKAFAKQTDSWKWRQFKVESLLPNKPYEEQLKKVPKGDEVPLAREVVTLLLVRFLSTGERGEFVRYRCRDVLPSGRRITVAFGSLGFDIGSVADEWMSPFIGLGSVYVPSVKTK